MVSKVLTSKKTFFLLIFSFLISSLALMTLENGVINETGLYLLIASMPLYLKIPVVATVTFLFLSGAQTFLCSMLSLKLNSLKNAVHLFGGATIVLSTLFLFLPVYQFKGYPGSVVKGKQIEIKVEKVTVNPETMSVYAKIAIDKNGKVTEGITSFNSPLITANGVVWIAGMDKTGILFKYQPFSLLPFATLASAICFYVSLLIQTGKILLKN
ncbi:hypothetical protein [Desulfurobacterium sp.]